MAGAKSAGNATLACGYEDSAFQAVSWLGQKPQATLRSPAVMKITVLLSRVMAGAKSAGNATLACGYEDSAFQAVF
jgi:uncharacterized protein YaaQ